MKVYNIKSKEDVVSILNERTKEKWDGSLILVNEQLEINNIEHYIRFSQGGSRWHDYECNISFEEVVEILWKNRKIINKILL